MGYLTLCCRHSHLIERRNRIENELRQMQDDLAKFQSYAAIVGSGNISIGAMLGAPNGYGQQLMGYLGYAHNASLQYVQQNAPMMMQMYMQNSMGTGQMQNPMQEAQMQGYIYRMLYSQGRERIKEMEQKRLAQIEHKMEQKKLQLEQDLKICEKQLNDIETAKNTALDRVMPKIA